MSMEGAHAAVGDIQNYHQETPLHPDSSSTADATLKVKLSRKRTKTGCLTCRRRRIKCGEERPICKNCIKSKRQCEGYSQRVVFRQSTFDYSDTLGGHASSDFQSQSRQLEPSFGYGSDFTQTTIDHSYYPPHHPSSHLQYSRPLPPVEGIHTAIERSQTGMVHSLQPSYSAYTQSSDLQEQHRFVGHSFGNGEAALPSATDDPGSSASHASHDHSAYNGDTTASSQSELRHPEGRPDRERHFENFSHSRNWTYPPLIRHNEINSFHPPLATLTKGAPWESSADPTPRHYTSATPQYGSVSNSNDSQEYSHEFPPADRRLFPHTRSTLAQPFEGDPITVYGNPQYASNSRFIGNLLSNAAVEVQDDDYYDVKSDEELDTSPMAVMSRDNDSKRNLHKLLSINNISIEELQTRRYDTFLYDGILEHYRVEDAANPLKNPATARVFAHFIAVTGPSLSVFERHLRSTSVLFTDGQIPYSQQGLWTYTMPVAALHHQGLLHSMLALASLHIARLQNASDTPSRQHYAWACKRMNSLLGEQKRRHEMTTIAASMLLGFYEIFTADHQKWNLHLSGSKQLFLETDFKSLAQKFRRKKRERVNQGTIHVNEDFPPSFNQSQGEIVDQIQDVDDELVSRLCGKVVSYEDPDLTSQLYGDFSYDFDSRTFEILRDLYWWYLKQDAYQSIISGNPPLLDYDRWADCPPRAPVGRVEAIYGSFDHLILLLGRIADFSSRDRSRKLKQIEANGGRWIPAQSLRTPGTPHAPSSHTSTPISASSAQFSNGSYFPTSAMPTPTSFVPPPFFGMAPPPRQNVQMPSSYHTTQSTPATETHALTEDFDLNAATHAALEEYGRIRAALLEFSESLGDAFRPLDPEYQPQVDTPFGTALYYRSYDIACLWAVYYMAVIIIIRSHPHAHPAAHASAALTAHETAFQANEIGRINAGIISGPFNQPLNPTLGAALCESCIPAFFAAIQYKNAQQRHDTVTRIHTIAMRTGWGSAGLIANGCETAWIKAAAAGRGPPHTRIVPMNDSDDPRVNPNVSARDSRADPDSKGTTDRSLVKTEPNARLMWAIGVIGTEEDDG